MPVSVHLHDDREVGVRRGDIENLTDTLDGARLERDVLDARAPHTLDDLSGVIRCAGSRSHQMQRLRRSLQS